VLVRKLDENLTRDTPGVRGTVSQNFFFEKNVQLKFLNLSSESAFFFDFGRENGGKTSFDIGDIFFSFFQFCQN
jgi:hypothetical protein